MGKGDSQALRTGDRQRSGESGSLQTEAQATSPNLDLTPWVGYVERIVPKIVPFHESQSAIRLLLGGNGTGKTTSGSWEATCFSTGYNPIRDETYPTPNEGWAVCLRLKDQGPILREALSRMLPQVLGRDGQPHPGWKYFKQSDIFELKKGTPGAGSIIRFKQQEDGSEAFFGGRPLWIWVDEEKKGQVGERNFNQMMARRTPGQKLHIFVTMTPENGFSWTYRRMYDQDPENHELIPRVAIFEVSKDDCLIENGGYIERAELEAEWEQWPEYEREARRYGRFNPMGTHPFYMAKLLLRKLETAPKGKSARITEGKYEEDEDRVGTIYRERESGHEYLGVWDPSSGTGGDFSDFVVLDRNNLAEVYHSSSNRMDPDLYALKYVLPAIKYYNQGMLAVEINGESGGAAIGAVRAYENLYYQKIWDKSSAQSTDRLGWRTLDSRDGGGSRSRIFDALSQALRENKWEPSFQLLQQMGSIVRVKTEKGWHAEHPDGKHDDHVVAMGIAMAIHYEEPIMEWPDLNRLAVRHRRTDSAESYSLIP